MPGKITIILTRRPLSLGSWLIRWAVPRSRFQLALASHSMVLDGDHVIHAHMLHGVIREPIQKAMHGAVEVCRRVFDVPDAESGISWARSQIGRKYDYSGAFGIAIAQERHWQHDDAWFCHELCAATIHKAGRRLFEDTGIVSDSAIMLAASNEQAGQAEHMNSTALIT